MGHGQSQTITRSIEGDHFRLRNTETTETTCHDRDHTYLYLSHPNLSMPFLGHHNESQAPLAIPEPPHPSPDPPCISSMHSKPSGLILSQLMSHQCIPNPLVLSRASSHLINTSQILWPHPKPVCILTMHS